MSRYDTREQIDTCLTCKKKNCTGDCYNVRAAGPQKPKKSGCKKKRIPEAVLMAVAAGKASAHDVARSFDCTVETVNARKRELIKGGAI